jgi:3-methylcrotonyl-CoA carboxylase alpha subunit
MEMNTRLQVEHPVTEMIVRRDLVQWQLHIAAGHPMPVKQNSIQGVGHALEARIYAENPDNQFLPATGRLLHLRPPPPAHDIRVESGVREGDEVSIFYDPMICKLVVWGPDRQQCLTRMSRALDEYQVVGPSNNIPFLRRAVKHPVFQKGQVETGFIADNIKDLLPKDRDGSKQIPHVALAVLNLLLEEDLHASRIKQETDPTSLWFDVSSFRSNIDVTRTISFTSSNSSNDEEKKVFKVLVKQKSSSDPIKRKQATYEFQVSESKINVSGRIMHDITQNSRHLLATIDNQTYQGDVVRHGQTLHVYIRGDQYTYNLPEVHYGSAEGTAVSGSGCPAPMAGKVVKVFVKANDVVKKGASLIVMEAMKMEHTIKAPFEGVISSVHFQQGDFVEGGKILVSFQKPSK